MMRWAVPSTLVVACILIGVPRCAGLDCYACSSAQVGVGACTPDRRKVETCSKPNPPQLGNSTSKQDIQNEQDTQSKQKTEADDIKNSLDQQMLESIKNLMDTQGKTKDLSPTRNVKTKTSGILRHNLIKGHQGKVEDMSVVSLRNIRKNLEHLEVKDVSQTQSVEEDYQEQGEDIDGDYFDTNFKDWTPVRPDGWEKTRKEEGDQVEEKAERNETSGTTVLEKRHLSKRSPGKEGKLLGGLPVDDQWCGSFKSPKDGYRRGCGVHLDGVEFEKGCHKMAVDHEDITYCRCEGDLCMLDETTGNGTRRRGSKVVTCLLAVLMLWWVG